MEAKFFIRVFLITVVIVMVMQIKVGSISIEDHTSSFIRTSAITQPLHGVTEGAVKALRDGSQWLTSQFHKQVNKHFGKRRDAAEDRPSSFHFGVKRSDAYEDEQKRKAAAADRE